jgi:hypothetical protein
MNAPVTPAKPVTPQPISNQVPATPGSLIAVSKPSTPTIPAVTQPKPAGVASTSASGPSKAPMTSPSASKPVMLKGKPPFQIERSTASGDSRWLKFMVYAEPGIGKTTLLGSAADIPDMRDILNIDCEKGDLVISDNDRIKEPQYVLENRIQCNDFRTVAQVHDFLKAHCKHRDENNIDKLRETEAWLRGVPIDEIIEPKRFRSVMIDTLSEVDTYCNYSILGVTQEKVLEEATPGGDVEVAGWAEFRKNNQMMQMICRAFRDLPIHVLVSAHRTYAEDERKRRYYSPALTGQLRTQVPGFFDIVGYMTTEKVGEVLERRMYVKPMGSTLFTAKNRRPMFKADYFKDPTMTDIMKGIGLLK